MGKFSSEEVAKTSICLGLAGGISFLHFTVDVAYLELHDVFEHLYYVPILLAAFWFGAAGGVALALATSAVYLVHILKDLAHYTLLDPLTHLVLYNLAALIVGLLSTQAHKNLAYYRFTAQRLAQAYEELRDTSESLRRAERLAALGQLSAGIAHEIRNPLGSIKGAVEILTADLPPGHPKEEFARIVRQEIRRISRLIEDFLRFARPPEPRVSRVKVAELVASAVRLIEGQAAKQGILIEQRIETFELAADEDQLRQVVLNLCMNALEAMTEGGRLRIEGRLGEDPDWYLLRVADTGAGLARGEWEHIFDPFYTTKPHGTGLGLSICHQLVRNHGGELNVEENPGEGLAFVVRLPLRSTLRLSEAV